VRAPGVERREGWLEYHRYLNMELLKEHKKEILKELRPDDAQAPLRSPSLANIG
jgi:hypothetical protein